MPHFFSYNSVYLRKVPYAVNALLDPQVEDDGILLGLDGRVQDVCDVRLAGKDVPGVRLDTEDVPIRNSAKVRAIAADLFDIQWLAGELLVHLREGPGVLVLHQGEIGQQLPALLVAGARGCTAVESCPVPFEQFCDLEDLVCREWCDDMLTLAGRSPRQERLFQLLDVRRRREVHLRAAYMVNAVGEPVERRVAGHFEHLLFGHAGIPGGIERIVQAAACDQRLGGQGSIFQDLDVADAN